MSASCELIAPFAVRQFIDQKHFRERLCVERLMDQVTVLRHNDANATARQRQRLTVRTACMLEQFLIVNDRSLLPTARRNLARSWHIRMLPARNVACGPKELVDCIYPISIDTGGGLRDIAPLLGARRHRVTKCG